MPYLVTFGDNGLSAGVTLVEEAPETLDDGVFYTEEVSEFFRYKTAGSVIRSATQEEIDAELAVLAAAEAARANRYTRDLKLVETDWMVIKAVEAGEDVPANVATYRQALRDITEHTEWPLLDELDWPTL